MENKVKRAAPPALARENWMKKNQNMMGFGLASQNDFGPAFSQRRMLRLVKRHCTV
jgi:hypothetical protein